AHMPRAPLLDGFPIVLAITMFVAGCTRGSVAESGADTRPMTDPPLEAITVGTTMTQSAAVVTGATARATSTEATGVRVLLGGDVIPHRPSLTAPSALENALAPLGPLFAKADVVVANYEAATGELEKKAFRLAYAAPPEWLEALPNAGIKA